MTSNRMDGLVISAWKWARCQREADEAKDDAIRRFASLRGRVKVREIAREAGVSPSAVSQFLSGKTTVGPSTAVALATAIEKTGLREDHHE